MKWDGDRAGLGDRHAWGGREWSMNGEEGRRKADLEAAQSKEESADTAEASN